MKKRPLAIAVFIFAVALTAALLYGFGKLALSGFISDSEIWAVANGKHLTEEWSHSWIATRPLFYLALATASAPFDNAISILYSAKVVGLLNGLLIAFFGFRLARRLAGNETHVSTIIPWAAVIFIFSCPGFMNQGYRIRSDLFSSWLTMFALERTLAAYTRFRPQHTLYWALPFLATPKAILHVLPALVLLPSRRGRSMVFTAMMACLLLAVFIYPEGVSVFLNTYASPELKQPLFSPERMVYLWRLLATSSFFFLLCGLRIITLALRLRANAFSETTKEMHLGFTFFAGVSALILLLSPEKVPFFLASFVPIFGIFGALTIDDLSHILPKVVPASRLRYHNQLLTLAIFSIFSLLGVNAAVNWKAFSDRNNSTLQFDLISQLENYLNDYPKATYYDVVGMVAQRAKIRVFAGPNDGEMNKNSVLMLETFYKPDLVFLVHRAGYLAGLREILKKNYFEIGPYAHARWQWLEIPLQLPLKKEKAEEFLKKMREYSGKTDLKEFSVLVRVKGKAEERRIVTADQLAERRQFKKNTALLAVSPFMNIGNFTTLLPSIIRFDWDWTGADESLEQ